VRLAHHPEQAPDAVTWVKGADEIIAKIERAKTKAKDLTGH
jgi:hypothetical protein